jgi:hypothetical protein
MKKYQISDNKMYLVQHEINEEFGSAKQAFQTVAWNFLYISITISTADD